MSNPFVDQALLERTVRHAAAYLRSLPARPVGARASRQDLLDALGGALPETGHDPAAVVDDLAAAADRGAIGSAGPRYFGFVIGGSVPAAVAADWLTTTWDQNAGIFVTSPLSSVIEEVARGWLLNLFSLPSDASLGFVTGCQMANFTCLAAARHAVLRAAGWDVEQDGLNGAPKINVVLSDEAHITIYVALRMLGLGVRGVHHVPADEQGRMKAGELRRTLKGIDGPTIVCAQAGNVNSGAFDPLREIGNAVREKGAWLHVDGAFGLWASVSDKLRPLLDGVELADSWATDAHKWLNVPYDCGVTIVRDLSAHRASMTSAAAYIQKTTGAERDPVDWVPEFSRRARGVTVYAALRALGRRGIVDLIERSCARARQFAELLSRDKRVKILNDVVLNQVRVRFGTSDEMTRDVIARVQQEGTCWLAGTTWHDVVAMRISVSNWATSESDVKRSAEAILSCVK